MDPKALCYEITRAYVNDNRSTLGDALYLKLNGFIRSRALHRLATCSELVPYDISCRRQKATLLQVEAFFKKNASFSDDEVCRQAALHSFNQSELRCKLTNKRLDYYFFKRDRLDPDLRRWLSRTERIVARTLGSFASFVEEIPQKLRVTSGATATRSRKQSHQLAKVTTRLDCTPRLLPYVKAMADLTGYANIRPTLIGFNRVEFVPKNWKTHRTIACEPTGNVPFQLAFDSYVKERLLGVGVDLSNQSLNQRLCKEAAMTNLLSTIDLKAASDTLALNTCAWLFPADWYRFLLDVRSPYYTLEGHIRPFHKLSSMGNGTTFGVETLIFTACVKAVGSKRYAVYGDDIIIESELAPKLIRLLRFLGFSVNPDKSFLTGPFRESCGVNYLGNKDITPFYIREVDKRKTVLSHLVNGLALVASPYGSLWVLLKRLCEDFSLVITPYSENTTSGVHVDVSTAHKLKLIRAEKDRHGKPYYMGLQAKQYSTVRRGPRVKVSERSRLFLWHLNALKRPEVPSEDFFLVRGKIFFMPVFYQEMVTAPSMSFKYKLRWSRWRVPAVGAHSRLYAWSDYVTGHSTCT